MRARARYLKRLGQVDGVSTLTRGAAEAGSICADLAQRRVSWAKGEYLPRFLALPFRAERGGAETLLAAIDVARKLTSRELDQLPADAPIQFVPSSWRVALFDGRDRPDRRMCELALAFAVRDALRSGDLYLAGSRHHVSFWNLVYGEDQ